MAGPRSGAIDRANALPKAANIRAAVSAALLLEHRGPLAPAIVLGLDRRGRTAAAGSECDSGGQAKQQLERVLSVCAVAGTGKPS